MSKILLYLAMAVYYTFLAAVGLFTIATIFLFNGVNTWAELKAMLLVIGGFTAVGFICNFIEKKSKKTK